MYAVRHFYYDYSVRESKNHMWICIFECLSEIQSQNPLVTKFTHQMKVEKPQKRELII